MVLVSEVQSTEFDQERFTDSPDVYVIASQPRSGSHYLAHLLRSTGQAGVPLEYFHARNWKSWMKRCGQHNPASAFSILCQLRTTPNGIFGVKAHWRQFQYACRLRLQPYLEDAGFIEIVRRDLLGQAISFVIANQTGRWIHEHKQVAEPEYSFPAIMRAIGHLTSERASWDRFFAVTGIESLRVTYEDLTTDRDREMTRVCEHLGIAWNPATTVEATVQRTPLSDEWRQRFLSTLPELHEENGFWRGEFGGLDDEVSRSAAG